MNFKIVTEDEKEALYNEVWEEPVTTVAKIIVHYLGTTIYLMFTAAIIASKAGNMFYVVDIMIV